MIIPPAPTIAFTAGFSDWLFLSSLVGFTLIYHVNTRAFKVPFPGVVMPNLQGTVRSITLPRAL
jgi:hypothetical protein